MRKYLLPLILTLSLLTLLASGCSLSTTKPGSPLATYTALAKTISAVQKQTAKAKVSHPLPSPAIALVTAVPTSTGQPTAAPTIVGVTTVTPQPVPCNRITYVSDVSVPDGSIFLTNQEFTKTWRLQNSGTCTWTTAYTVVFFSGYDFGAPSSFSLNAQVEPGQMIDLSMPMRAPADPGVYRSNWKMRDANNQVFGIDPQASDPFWVTIRVYAATKTITPTVTWTETRTITPKKTVTPTRTFTPTTTFTSTLTFTPTLTNTPTVTSTPTDTATPTDTPTPTETPIATVTPETKTP